MDSTERITIVNRDVAGLHSHLSFCGIHGSIALSSLFKAVFLFSTGFALSQANKLKHNSYRDRNKCKNAERAEGNHKNGYADCLEGFTTLLTGGTVICQLIKFRIIVCQGHKANSFLVNRFLVTISKTKLIVQPAISIVNVLAESL